MTLPIFSRRLRRQTIRIDVERLTEYMLLFKAAHHYVNSDDVRAFEKLSDAVDAIDATTQHVLLATQECEKFSG